MKGAYHHGDLRAAVLQRAVEVIATEGAGALSLRSLAADLGVSHTAPRHHFGSREGVLTAVAAQGFGLLGEALAAAREGGGTFLDVGVAYVDFALGHPAHFAVMFAPKLLDESDDELVAARAATFAELQGGVRSQGRDRRRSGDPTRDEAAQALAAWSLVHGLATLALDGNLDRSQLTTVIADGDVLAVTRRTAALLYPTEAPNSRR